MSPWLKKKSGNDSWIVFTDLMVGLFTVFVFAFLAVWIVKEKSHEEIVEQDKELTRKEAEFQACVDEKKETQAKLSRYQSVLGQKLEGHIREGKLVIADDGKIHIQASLLFPLGHSRVSPEGRKLIRSVSEALKIAMAEDSSFIIMVAGHTDNIPVKQSYYRSNWELSTQRAMNVMREMLGSGVSGEDVFAAGFGEHQPKVPNTSEENRRMNRRVEIRRLSRFQQEGP